MGVEGNLLVMGIERYILTSNSYGVEIKCKLFVTLGLGSGGCYEGNLLVMGVERYILTSSSYSVEIK